VSDDDPAARPDRLAQRANVYDKLRHVVDEDALHDLISRHGPAILDREFPYLVVAARNQVRGRLRRRAREVALTDEASASLVDTGADPETSVTRKISLQSLVDAMAESDDTDVLLLWRQAEGVPDDEVIAEWVARGLVSQGFSRAALRKQRQRARARLRETLIGRSEERH
jgi:hypothetical protein